MWRAFCITTCLAVACAAKGTAQTPHDNRAACTLETSFSATVTKIIDGETVVLDDSTELRLVGALVPRDTDVFAAGSWKPALNSTVFLRELLLNRVVTIAVAEPARDRYGRRVTHVFVEGGSGRLWVQGEMLKAGMARAYTLPGRTACLAELLAHEAFARSQRAGLWSERVYRIKQSGNVKGLMRMRGTFQIVEGKIAKVSTRARMTYINFGEDWKTDFSIGISSTVMRQNPEWTAKLASLVGSLVRVRGWIERRNGPFITINHVDEIEVLGEVSPSPETSSLHTPSAGDGADDTAADEDNERLNMKKRPALSVPDASLDDI